jgi:hypothetical protein
MIKEDHDNLLFKSETVKQASALIHHPILNGIVASENGMQSPTNEKKHSTVLNSCREIIRVPPDSREGGCQWEYYH